MSLFSVEKLEEVKLRLRAVECLRTLKGVYTYKFLSRITGLSASVLSRYVRGHVLPSLDRSKALIAALKKSYLVEAIRRKVSVANGVLDVSELLSDPTLLGLVAKVAVSEFSFASSISVVLTKETDGVPLATLVASELGARLAIAKKGRELGVQGFLEAKQVFPSGVYTYIYLPRSGLKRRDRVLIVDDIIRSGSTVSALAELCTKARATVVGAFAIFSLGRPLSELTERFNFPVKVLVEELA